MGADLEIEGGEEGVMRQRLEEEVFGVEGCRRREEKGRQ